MSIESIGSTDQFQADEIISNQHKAQSSSGDVAKLVARELMEAVTQNSSFSEISVGDLGEYYYRLAKLHYDRSDFESSEKAFLKAISYFEMPRGAFSAFKACGFLIRIYSEAQNEEMADVYICRSETILETISTSFGTLGSEYFYNAGIVRTYRGQFPEARESFLLAYRKSQEENEPSVMAKSLCSLAMGHYTARDYKQAKMYLDQLSQLLQILRKEYLQGSMYVLYGNVCSELGEFTMALEHYGKAMRVLQQKNCWNLYAYTVLGRGIVYKKIGDYSKALVFFHLAKDLASEVSYKRLNSIIKAEISDVNDANVDLYLDRTNRTVHEKTLGTIDFKHRFVLLEILFLLAKNPGKYFDKDELSKSIWREEYNPLIHDKLIYTSISRLRKLIEPKNSADSKRRYILRGKDGYTFNPNIKARFQRENAVSGVSNIGNVELTSPV